MSAAAETNPLFAIQHPIAFDRIRSEHVEPAIDELLAQSREQLAALERADLPMTYEATLLAFEDATLPLERAMTVVGHLEAVSTTPELRAAYNAVQPKVSALMSSIPLSAGLFRMLQTFSATECAKQLDPTRARFLSKTLDWFKREGAGLSPTDKTRLEQLNVELTEITTRFGHNVLDSTNAFELMLDEVTRLAGLPQRAVDAARASAEQKGKSGYRFTLQAPSYIPLLTYAHDRELREQLYRAMNTRATAAPYDNRALVARILELRREKARLLGYANFVDLVLHDRMAHDAARAMGFIVDLETRTRPAFGAENAALQAFAGSIQLQPWDIAYYSEKQRLDLYAFNEEELRPYFPLEGVLSGMFGIVQRLYGIVVDEVHELPVWHPTVRSFRIRDADGSLLGYFYADLFPREQKRDGAWMNAFLTGEAAGEGYTPHVGLISANMTPPLGDAPALLGHREVETIFHEFGHLLHHMLSRVPVRSLAGTNVAWDFVELPSQIMENFCWEREALDVFARHYRSGAAIPPELYQKLRRARTYRGANDMMRQLGFATLDLELHTLFDEARPDAALQARAVMSRFAPAPLPADYAMVLGFGHLFAHPVGYAGGYYSYKWAEVLDADAFSRFAQEGVFSEQVGSAFRERILARGDSRDPMELFKDFMGREPDLRALLVRSGIADAPSLAAPTV